MIHPITIPLAHGMPVEVQDGNAQYSSAGDGRPLMFLEMLRRSDVSDLVKRCSPALFKVLSTREVAREIKALVGFASTSASCSERPRRYGDDAALFRRSLATLNLSSAEALVRKHFGEGDQHAVTSLFQSLEQLGAPHDVRRAFEDATRTPPAT